MNFVGVIKVVVFIERLFGSYKARKTSSTMRYALQSHMLVQITFWMPFIYNCVQLKLCRVAHLHSLVLAFNTKICDMLAHMAICVSFMRAAKALTSLFSPEPSP